MRQWEKSFPFATKPKAFPIASSYLHQLFRFPATDAKELALQRCRIRHQGYSLGQVRALPDLAVERYILPRNDCRDQARPRRRNRVRQCSVKSFGSACFNRGHAHTR